MRLPLFWTEEAKETFGIVTNFILQTWGDKQVEIFIKKASKTLENISSQPYIFKSSSIQKDVRKGLIRKQTSVFYQIESDKIVILFFWDNRQKPIID